VSRDLQYRLGPIEPVLARLDPLLENSIHLSEEEFENLVAFVKQGLLDPRARRHNLCQLVPASVPSGQPTLRFEGCLTPR
jgi:cytochrome c peroxidase